MKNIFLLDAFSEFEGRLRFTSEDLKKFLSIFEIFGTAKTQNLSLIRYLWTAFKIDINLINQYPSYFLEEMAKLTFNGHSVEK